MRSILLALVLGALPMLAHADTIYTSASANTGGSYAEGGTVQTGAASAGVSSTVISGSSGGTSTVDITTTQNGVTETEHSVKTYAPGQTISVFAATSSGSAAVVPNSAVVPGNVSTAIPAHVSWQKKQVPAVPAASSTHAVSATISTTVAEMPAKHVFATMWNYLSRFLTIFGW